MSRRPRRRYLLAQLKTKKRINSQTFSRLISDQSILLYGVQGLTLGGPKLIAFDEEGNRAILRCNHDWLSEMRCVLASIKSVGDQPARVDVKLVSGTLKSLKKKTGWIIPSPKVSKVQQRK